MFTAYLATKTGKIALCTMPTRWREVEKTAADMSKGSDVERVSVAAYDRIIAAYKDGVRIDIESSQHGVDTKIYLKASEMGLLSASVCPPKPSSYLPSTLVSRSVVRG